ncbi:MAG: hypothetical protein WAW36_14605 [Methylovulum miyakonense]|uniref:hypothetical protein n=1 Tax=Methylovulum miyakonense TaxID=645578 RepID=UPI003BB7E15D
MKLMTRRKPRVFLGALLVVPKTHMRKHLEQWGLVRKVELDGSLRASLQEIFSLPPACEVTNPKPDDLGLEVIVTSYQSGDFLDIELGEIGFPVFWRPKVTVVCRLYFLKSLETKCTFSITQKMAWNKFVARVFSWGTFSRRVVFRLDPIFDAEDMNHLLYLACHTMLKKIRNSVS